jgi:outer membrane protein assembly factor BamE (lipoprotein component of BamABCDE complex)
MKKVILIFAVFLLFGCSYEKIAKKNNELMLTLDRGQTKQEVLKIMGNPSKNEKYFADNNEMDVWFYRTSSFVSGGWDSDDYFTPMVFENGKLTGWGNDFYEQRKIDFQAMIKKY